MLLGFAFGVDKDVIKAYSHENVELLCQNLINVALKCGQSISQSKRHYLLSEMAIAALEDRFPFITFPVSHLMVKVGEITLCKTLSLI